MIYKIIDEQPFQVLTSSFSIGPSQTGYELCISADGENYSPLFSVGSGVTRLVTNVASGSYYKLEGNEGEVSVNWRTSCKGEGGGGGEYILPPATSNTLGGVKIGSGITVQPDGTISVSGGTGGISNILPAITSQAEYAAISGSIKTGDLIQVLGVDLDGDGEPEAGLFEANSPIPGELYWTRRDNYDSLVWAEKNYPWMADNGVYPCDLGTGSYFITPTPGEDYIGIGFTEGVDGYEDGTPTIARFTPQIDEQTGDITGMTRTDTPIGGGLPVGYEADDWGLNDNYQIVTIDGKLFGEDLYDIPAFHNFENGYSDNERGYVSGNNTKVFGYYDEDENFVPVFLPAGTYAVLNTDDFDTEHYGKVINLFYGKVGDEDVIYNNTFYAQDLDSINLKTPLFTITEPTCPTTEDNYYQLYLDYTDKPSVEEQINTIDEVVSAALVDLNEKKVESEDVKHIVRLSQSDYDDIDIPDPNTLYIIINNS